jgi:hypothetical protein
MLKNIAVAQPNLKLSGRIKPEQQNVRAQPDILLS